MTHTARRILVFGIYIARMGAVWTALALRSAEG